MSNLFEECLGDKFNKCLFRQKRLVKRSVKRKPANNLKRRVKHVEPL